MARSIVDALMKGEQEAQAFFPAHPSDASYRRALVERVSRPLNAAVATELSAQNAVYAPSAAREQNLALLGSGAAAVVTGQQVGLFLGPLYTLYKAAAAIADARQLAKETGRPVVPVFWLQTEDHDLPEIALCELPSSGAEPVTLRLPASPQDRSSVEQLRLPDAVTERLRELGALLGPSGAAHLQTLARHYRAGAGWTEAFAGMVAELFSTEGLVLVNPRRLAIASAVAGVHLRAITEAETIAGVLQARADELVAKGFSASVHIRPGSPLSFFHPEGAAGPRYRLEPSSDRFTEVGGAREHLQQALLDRLAADPLSFSSSALLRPIIQDTLLPTVAYVGGPGELAYFAQLGPLYQHFGLPMPVIVPRARFRLIEPRIAALLKQRGLQPSASEKTVDELLAGTGAGSDDALSGLYRQLDAALVRVTDHVGQANPSLATPIRKTQSTVRRAVGKLRRKYEIAQRRGDDPAVAELLAIKGALSPRGAPQERVFGLSAFAALVGERALIDAILSNVEPFDGALRDIYL